MGDISLGCWTDSQQVNQATASNAAGNGPADGTAQPQGCSMARVTDEAQQPSTAEGCCTMDLTNYFATLPNEVVAFTDLVMPSPVSSDFVYCQESALFAVLCHYASQMALQVFTCTVTVAFGQCLLELCSMKSSHCKAM